MSDHKFKTGQRVVYRGEEGVVGNNLSDPLVTPVRIGGFAYMADTDIVEPLPSPSHPAPQRPRCRDDEDCGSFAHCPECGACASCYCCRKDGLTDYCNERVAKFGRYLEATGQAERREAQPARRFAVVGMRVRCIRGGYAGEVGTVTHVRVMKNNCRVEFDGSEGCGVTCSLELGEYLECLLEEQARSLTKLPVTMVRPPIRANSERTGPYGGNDTTHEAMLYERQKADDEMSGRRAHLLSQLASEQSRPVAVKHPGEGRLDRVYQPRVLGGKL